VTGRMQGKTVFPWAHWPLQRLFFFITAVVLVFLASVLALGVRQYLLYHQCRQAVTGGDRLLFQFTAIKDHLNESLILKEDINLRAFNGELQNLEKEVKGLADNILVPEGLKGSLPTRVDLVGLEVRLRAIQEQRQEKIREAAELVRSLNNTNVGLQQFRFLLSDHTQAILLGLHRIIVGALGLIVVLSCTLLYLLNRHLAVPMLNLCRLTADEQTTEKGNDTDCSMEMLTTRINGLLAESGERQWTKGGADRADPRLLQEEARRYRYAVIGCMGSELASELTNRINGVINYTQNLIDINEQEDSRLQAAGLYQLLITEEKKTAELVAALQRVSGWQSARGASSIPLSPLFRMVALVLDKPLRAESIILNLPTECRHEITVAAGDLWLVLLTLLQQGRRALNRAADSNPHNGKRLNVECRAQSGEHIRLILTNTTGTWAEESSGSAWPSLTFCTHLLHMHQASLNLEATVQGERLLVDLPCRSSVA
jgi:hypothetical protein